MLDEMVEKVFEAEVKIVRTVCHNVLKAPLYGKELQDVVILHLRNFKVNLLRTMKEMEHT